jgi:hypothetical protein
MTEFTMTDIDAQYVELLPTKETLFYVNFGNHNWSSIYASNSSLAVNAATLLSSAESAAVQSISVTQG